MKRWFNILQWIVLGGAVLVVAWIVTRPSPPLDYAPETWANWDGFMAISYAGVTRDESATYPSSRTLIQHLEAIKSAGYHTVTPDDVLAFLEHRTPLPDQALLILFEGARKETFIRAHPPLRRLGMKATLCVPTESLKSWDESRLRKRDVDKLSRLPQWSVASMGDEAVVPVMVSETGVTDHFLSARKWLPRESRVERDDEFRRRVADDYRISSELLSKLTGKPVTAYVYPYADDGRRAGADPMAADVNSSSITSSYCMAFVSASNPYNPPGRNPFTLSRLRINGDWSAAQVLEHLAQSRPLTGPVDGVVRSSQWTVLCGAHVAEGGIQLNTGDAAWLKGSELWGDARISGVLSRGPGAAVACYSRFMGPADGVRLSISDKDIRLQESRGGPPVTLVVVPSPTGQVVRFDWIIKGNRSWLDVDGHRVFGNVPLAPSKRAGTIGFESSSGHVSVSGIGVHPLPRTGLAEQPWYPIPEDKRILLTDFLPKFPPPGQDIPPEQAMDVIQAVSEGALVWPILQPDSTGHMSNEQLSALAAMLTRKDLRPFISGFVLDATLSRCGEWVRGQGFKVMYRVKPGEPIPVGVTNRVDCVWFEGTGTNLISKARELLHRHPPTQLMVQDPLVISRVPRVGLMISSEEGKSP